MSNKYKLLALDMDGTLLRDDHEISPETVIWIKKAVEHGIHVCLSTGRGFASALPYGEQLGLSTPMVTVNGSEVWKAPHDLYRRSYMDVQLVKDMYDIGIRKNSWFWAYSVDTVYNKEHWIQKPIENEQWLKFGYHTEDHDVRHEILMELQNMGGLEITNSSPFNLEINPQGVNKATGILEVCRLLGIEMSEVIAVGDSMNDLAVIQQAGLGVAMGNAQQVVKDEADVVVATNNEDGIVEVIQKYIFG
ncbi:HAD superfamily hydrolase (TIGR01484 family) [Paenibacillus sp. DS2015]|uniref:Cof-type HAD-IIB family hydrolase n=1 Tax=Paenibacillus sp. DS2015 TaxID=3373917 RepID=UPI003D1AD7DF